MRHTPEERGPWPWSLAAVAFVGGTCGSLVRALVQWSFDRGGLPAWGAHAVVNVAGSFAIVGVLGARASEVGLGAGDGVGHREGVLVLPLCNVGQAPLLHDAEDHDGRKKGDQRPEADGQLGGNGQSLHGATFAAHTEAWIDPIANRPILSEDPVLCFGLCGE